MQVTGTIKATKFITTSGMSTQMVMGDGSLSSTAYGASTQSGTGLATSYTISHGLGSTPTWFIVNAASSDAQNIAYVIANSTTITIYYNLAPPSGTNNLVFNWRAIK